MTSVSSSQQTLIIQDQVLRAFNSVVESLVSQKKYKVAAGFIFNLISLKYGFSNGDDTEIKLRLQLSQLCLLIGEQLDLANEQLETCVRKKFEFVFDRFQSVTLLTIFWILLKSHLVKTKFKNDKDTKLMILLLQVRLYDRMSIVKQSPSLRKKFQKCSATCYSIAKEVPQCRPILLLEAMITHIKSLWEQGKTREAIEIGKETTEIMEDIGDLVEQKYALLIQIHCYLIDGQIAQASKNLATLKKEELSFTDLVRKNSEDEIKMTQLLSYYQLLNSSCLITQQKYEMALTELRSINDETKSCVVNIMISHCHMSLGNGGMKKIIDIKMNGMEEIIWTMQSMEDRVGQFMSCGWLELARLELLQFKVCLSLISHVWPRGFLFEKFNILFQVLEGQYNHLIGNFEDSSQNFEAALKQIESQPSSKSGIGFDDNSNISVLLCHMMVMLFDKYEGDRRKLVDEMIRFEWNRVDPTKLGIVFQVWKWIEMVTRNEKSNMEIQWKEDETKQRMMTISEQFWKALCDLKLAPSSSNGSPSKSTDMAIKKMEKSNHCFSLFHILQATIETASFSPKSPSKSRQLSKALLKIQEIKREISERATICKESMT